MAIREPTDLASVPGTALSAKPVSKYQQNVAREISLIGGKATKLRDTWSAMQSSLGGTTDINEETKIISSSDIASVAGGLLTIDKTTGGFVFSEPTTQQKNPIFKAGSPLYSIGETTILGSTNIKTVGKDILNPLSTAIPSSHFSPVRGWVKSLIPGLDTDDLLVICIIEAIQVALLMGLAALREEDPQVLPTSANTRPKTKDMGRIIIDNAEFEKKILERALRKP